MSKPITTHGKSRTEEFSAYAKKEVDTSIEYLTSRNGALETKNKALEDDNIALANRIAALEEQNTILRDEKAALESSNRDGIKKAITLHKMIGEQDDKLGISREEILRLEQYVAELESSIKTVIARLESMDGKPSEKLSATTAEEVTPVDQDQLKR